MNKSEIMALADNYAKVVAQAATVKINGFDVAEEIEEIKSARAEIEAALDVPKTLTEEQHIAAVKVLLRANGLDGLPQRMLDAMLAAAPEPAIDVKIQGTNPVVSQISGNVNDKEPAQAEQPKATCKKPLQVQCWVIPNGLGGQFSWEQQDERFWTRMVPAAQAERPRNEPVQQEPIARLAGVDEYGPRIDWFKHWINVPVGTVFYTSPQAQPMSDEQAIMLMNRHGGNIREIIRAVERFHKIGG